MARGFIAALSLLLTPVPALGEAGWTSYAQIAELTATHHRYLVVLRVTTNPSGCANKNVFYQDLNSSGSELMFRILVEGITAGKRVRVYVTGNCELNGYSEISSVSLAP